MRPVWMASSGLPSEVAADPRIREIPQPAAGLGRVPYRSMTSFHRRRTRCSRSQPRTLTLAGWSARRRASLARRPSQRAASTRRKCPLEKTSASPAACRTRSSVRSARAPTLGCGLTTGNAVAPQRPARHLEANPCRATTLEGAVVPLRHLTSPHLISLHLISPHRISPHRIAQRLRRSPPCGTSRPRWRGLASTTANACPLRRPAARLGAGRRR